MRKITRQRALSNHLGCNFEDVEQRIYDTCLFDVGQSEYLVLTENGANARVKTSILDTLWTFNSDFLASHSECADADTFRMLQEKCEDSNRSLKRLIKDLSQFVSDAILSDSRGHFLSSYDGEENEEGGFLIYRMN